MHTCVSGTGIVQSKLVPRGPLSQDLIAVLLNEAKDFKTSHIDCELRSYQLDDRALSIHSNMLDQHLRHVFACRIAKEIKCLFESVTALYSGLVPSIGKCF